jgi:hypothetical protein
MKPLLDKTVSKKSNDIVRLYRPPSLEEMVTGGKYFSMVTGEKSLSLPNELSSEIMRHLDYCYLHLLILVNKSFYNVLNRSRSLENGLTILVYGHERIDSVLLKGLYEGDEAYLNQHKAKCNRGHIPLCSMIICCTEWPDIDPRKLHLFSLVNPKYPNTLAFRTFWCGNIIGFYHILFDQLLLPDDPSFQHSTFNTNRISYKVLNWREPTFKYENSSSELVWSYFDFSLKDGHLQATVEYLEKTHILINVLPEFSSSTNLPTDLSLESNTLKLGVDQFSVILMINKCEKLIHL